MYPRSPYLAIDKKPEYSPGAYEGTRRLWLVVAERPKTLLCMYLGRYDHQRLSPLLPAIHTYHGVWVAPGRWSWRRREYLEVRR